jgi:DNA-binding beta-propeller fold protein YncE
MSLEVTSVFGEVGRSPGQFTYPRAIDNDGKDLWIIDKSARVQRIDPATGKGSALWTMPEWEHGKPTGVTIGPPLPVALENRPSGVQPNDPYLLYIPDTHYHRVMIYRPPASLEQEPELVARFGEFGEGSGQFVYPTDVAVLTAADGRTVERLYVSEYGGNDRISVFDAQMKFLFAFGKLGDSDGADGTVEFSRPQSMQIDTARRQLIVTDACNHRLGVFTLDGKLVRWIGSPKTSGEGPDSFSYPYGLVLMGDGTALVSEFGNHRVHRVNYDTGESLGTFGSPGRGRGQFATPWGVTILNGTVYVLDSANERVQAFKEPALLTR